MPSNFHKANSLEAIKWWSSRGCSSRETGNSTKQTNFMLRSVSLQHFRVLPLLGLSNSSVLTGAKVCSQQKLRVWAYQNFNLWTGDAPSRHTTQQTLKRTTSTHTHTHTILSLQVSTVDDAVWLRVYSLIRDFLLSQIYIWTTTTWSNVWVVLPKPSWYEFLIGFLIWTHVSKYLHLTTFSNICVILSMFLYL